MKEQTNEDAEFNAVEAAKKGKTAAKHLTEFFGANKENITIKTTVWSDGDYTVTAIRNYAMAIRSGAFAEQCIYSSGGKQESKNQFTLSVKYEPFTAEGMYKEPRLYKLATR